MCPRCALQLMPLTAERCFQDHPRPHDIEPWTLWVCPGDDAVVTPEDVNFGRVLEANKNNPLLAQKVLAQEPGNPGIGLNAQVSPLFTFLPDQSRTGPEQAQARADPNDTLVTIAGPILAGFSLAAIVVIGTSVTAGRPQALPAIACFAGSASLLLFSIQMLVIGSLSGLRNTRWPRIIKGVLYELGLLAFFAGLGLFLWLRTWPWAARVSVAVVGLAVVCDLLLLATAWFRRNQWGHRH